MFARFPRLGSNQFGNVSTIVAVFAPLAAVLTALAVDAGLIASKQRQLQGLADLAAISAARDVENAEQVARLTLALNGFSGARLGDVEGGELTRELEDRYSEQVKVETGSYSADPEVAYTQRFVPGTGTVNAVRVTLKEEEPRYFSKLLGRRELISVTGTAAISSEAAMSIGSRLVGLEDGLANAMLSALTGSNISLSVMDYRGLARADVDLLEFFDVLATNVDLDAVTFDQVLDADVSLADIVDAMADVNDDTVGVAASLRSVAGARGVADIVVPLRAMFDLGSAADARLGTPMEGLDLHAGVLEMLTAAAMVANGDRQIDLDLDLDLAGLASVDVALLVGERPQSSTWFALSEQGRAVVSTAQTRLFLEVNVHGLGLLHRDLLRLPIYAELASAEARIVNVVCESGEDRARRVDVDVQPGILTLRIADLDGDLVAISETQEFEPAHILHTGLLDVDASAEVAIVSPESQRLRFYRSTIDRGEPLTVSTRDALAEALENAVRDLDLDVRLLGISLISTDSLQSLIADILAEVVSPVDTLIFDLASMLGLGLGEADVWVHDAKCNRSVLVQ